MQRPKTTVRLAQMTLPIAGVLLMSVEPSAAARWRNAASNTRGDASRNNGGITLSAILATVFTDNVGHAAHGHCPNSVVYVNTWSGRYYANTEKRPRGSNGAAEDTTGSGRADKVRFASARESRAAMPAGRKSHFTRRAVRGDASIRRRRLEIARPRRPRSSFQGCR